MHCLLFTNLYFFFLFLNFFRVGYLHTLMLSYESVTVAISVHVNQCIYGRWYSRSRKFWECDWYDLRNTSSFHVSLLTWYREYLNTLLVLLSWKKTLRYRINKNITPTSITYCLWRQALINFGESHVFEIQICNSCISLLSDSCRLTISILVDVQTVWSISGVTEQWGQ